MFFSDKKVKEAFSKVKEEMDQMHSEITALKEELHNISTTLGGILNEVEEQKLNHSREKLRQLSAEFSLDVPRNVPNFTPSFIKDDFGTSDELKKIRDTKMPISDELTSKEPFSIGNEGVSALRQQIGTPSAHLELRNRREEVKDIREMRESAALGENVEKLKQALKEIFKTLTKQEFYVFSLLYQLEEELKRPVTYGDLASRTQLTPNSIRDYISKLMAKKVPIIKEKHNNRQILLKVAPELRNLETLESLMRLVESS